MPMNENAGPTDDLIDHILSNLDESGLTEWEKDFLTSVRAYWKKHRRLSDKQQKRLKEIWEDVHNAKRVHKEGAR